IEHPIEIVENLTYKSTIPYFSDETNKYRMRNVNDSLVYMMPAYIGDNFPSQNSIISEVNSDQIGDAIEPSNDYTDFTGQYFAYSENKFYSGLTNVANEFPLDNGGWMPSEYYIYMTALFNPETALEDTVAYAMINAQVGIPGIFGIEPGVYKISNLGPDMDLESFELLGDLETTMLDGMLVMQCDIETITSDEDFGDWPSMTNTLGMISFSAIFTMSGGATFCDYTVASALNINQGIIEPFTNDLPILSNPTVVDQDGYCQISVNYSDENNNFPLTAKAIFDDNSEINFTPTSFDFEQDVEFQIFNDFGWESATLFFSDNDIDFVEVEITSSAIDGNVSSSIINNFINYPNPFNPETNISFNLTKSSNVKLSIYNIKGELVKNLLNQNMDLGNHNIKWNGIDNKNNQVSSGMYFIELDADNYKLDKKILLLK
ncbi:MAG: FlgD immunoglobulin-like domain containing protein, partial [Candidatus Cloacimonadota bacterium]|nr:FlgD immunoglobulin-like domain containing protein [Candidatus Cloacimonadota bacterium]